MKSAFRKQAVLITGAAGGLGGALAGQLTESGARLMLLDKDSRGLDRVHDRILETGLEAPGICPLDLSSAGPEEFGKLAEIMASEFDGLHHLIHCAAEFDGLSPLDQVRPSDWLKCMQANLNAAWLLTVQCLPLLKQHQGSSITFVLDRHTNVNAANWGAYGVSKSALRHLGGMFREELEGSPVSVLTAEPGPMRSALRARAYLAEHPESQADPDLAAREIIEQIAQAVFQDAEN